MKLMMNRSRDSAPRTNYNDFRIDIAIAEIVPLAIGPVPFV
jgi:hypothetical protein